MTDNKSGDSRLIKRLIEESDREIERRNQSTEAADVKRRENRARFLRSLAFTRERHA